MLQALQVDRSVFLGINIQSIQVFCPNSIFPTVPILLVTPCHTLAQPQDSNEQVKFKLKAKGGMEPPHAGDSSGTDASDDEEEVKQTNGPKQEIRYIWDC